MADSSKRGAHFGTPGRAAGSDSAFDKTTMMPSREYASMAPSLLPDDEATEAGSAGATPMDRTQVMPHAAAPLHAPQPTAARSGVTTQGSVSSRDYDAARGADEPSHGGRNAAVAAVIIVVALVAVAFVAMFFAKLGPFAQVAEKEETQITDSAQKDDDAAAKGDDVAAGSNASQQAVVDDDVVATDSGNGQVTVPSGGEGANNEVDAGEIFGNGASDNGGTSDSADSNQGGDANQGNGDQGGAGTDDRDPADNDTPAENGPVTEPDGSQWTGYY